ncbi:MAG: glycosyltransferase [Desulfococcaceae bacterium]
MIDIIIVNYNSTGFLIQCLVSVQKALNDLPARIYVQDNASKDRPERIRALFPDVLLNINPSNYGFAKAVNQALRQGHGEYAVLLNPDTYVTDDFFQTAIDYMEKHSHVGILGPKILDNDGMLQNSARAFPTPLTAFFGRSSYLSRRFPKNPITSRNLLSLKSDGKTPMNVDWVSGACMVVRRKAIDSAGLMDERFFMYWEDADWCRRMWEKGWKVVYYPSTTVYHYVGGSSGKKVTRSLIEFHKSVYRLFDKYADASLSFFSPLVLAGLGVRLLFVLFSNFFEYLFKIQPPMPCAENPHLPEKRIRILRIISRLNVGGPAIHVHLLTKGLDSQKFESILVTGRISPQEGDMSYLFRPGDPQPLIIPELQREISIPSDVRTFFRILKMLYAEKPDIVDTHTAKAGFAARFSASIYNLLSRKHSVSIIHTFHGHVFEGYFSPMTTQLFINIERLLARISDAIIVISDTQKQELTGKYRIASSDKIRTIPLGFDLSPFLSASDLRGKFRQDLHFDSNVILIGIIGRLVPIKNHNMFFQSAKRFREIHPDIAVKYIVIGNGELRGELEELCSELKLKEDTVFCGWIKEVPYVYADLDILALTSLNEGTPVSIIESMAAGVPVIATDAGGVRDLLGAGPYPRVCERGSFLVCERGILCRKNDSEGFSKGLTYLVCENSDIRRKRIENARQYVREHFDRERLFRDTEALYMELAGKKRNNRSQHPDVRPGHPPSSV